MRIGVIKGRHICKLRPRDCVKLLGLSEVFNRDKWSCYANMARLEIAEDIATPAGNHAHIFD
jgi:hypothetical protein